VERPVGQATHFGVAAFSGVLSQSVWQRDYLLEGQQHRGTKNTLTRVAACTISTKGV
jgi:hypothetical protein